MKKYVFKNLVFIVMIVCVIMSTGCGKKSSEPVQTDANSKYISISTKDLVVPLGSTKTFDIVLTDAVGRFDIVSNNTGVATSDSDVLWIEGIDGETDTKTITVTGNAVGSAQISINLTDVSSYDTVEPLTGTYTVNVTVK